MLDASLEGVVVRFAHDHVQWRLWSSISAWRSGVWYAAGVSLVSPSFFGKSTAARLGVRAPALPLQPHTRRLSRPVPQIKPLRHGRLL